jgi:hypothetical protein
MEGTPQQPHSPQAVPAGWYPDPAGEGLRYWDGSGWTTHTAPAAGGQHGEAGAGGAGAEDAAAGGASATSGAAAAASPASTAAGVAGTTPGDAAAAGAPAVGSEGPSRQEWIRSGLIGLIPLAGLVWGVYLVRKKDGREGPGNLAVILSLTVILILVLVFR